MLDTKELRTALARHGTSVLNEDEVLELLDRLEAAEKTNSDWLRANAPGGWIDALRLECDYLFARIEEMEKQEPVARFNWSKGKIEWLRSWDYNTMNMKPLFLAPGALLVLGIPKG